MLTAARRRSHRPDGVVPTPACRTDGRGVGPVAAEASPVTLEPNHSSVRLRTIGSNRSGGSRRSATCPASRMGTASGHRDDAGRRRGPVCQPGPRFASSSAHRSGPRDQPGHRPVRGRLAGVKNCKTNSAAFCRRAARLFASPFDFADLTRTRKCFQTAKTAGTLQGPTCVQRHRGRGAPPRNSLLGKLGNLQTCRTPIAVESDAFGPRARPRRTAAKRPWVKEITFGRNEFHGGMADSKPLITVRRR